MENRTQGKQIRIALSILLGLLGCFFLLVLVDCIKSNENLSITAFTAVLTAGLFFSVFLLLRRLRKSGQDPLRIDDEFDSVVESAWQDSAFSDDKPIPNETVNFKGHDKLGKGNEQKAACEIEAVLKKLSEGYEQPPSTGNDAKVIERELESLAQEYHASSLDVSVQTGGSGHVREDSPGRYELLRNELEEAVLQDLRMAETPPDPTEHHEQFERQNEMREGLSDDLEPLLETGGTLSPDLDEVFIKQAYGSLNADELREKEKILLERDGQKKACQEFMERGESSSEGPSCDFVGEDRERLEVSELKREDGEGLREGSGTLTETVQERLGRAFEEFAGEYRELRKRLGSLSEGHEKLGAVIEYCKSLEYKYETLSKENEQIRHNLVELQETEGEGPEDETLRSERERLLKDNTGLRGEVERLAEEKSNILAAYKSLSAEFEVLKSHIGSVKPVQKEANAAAESADRVRVPEQEEYESLRSEYDKLRQEFDGFVLENRKVLQAYKIMSTFLSQLVEHADSCFTPAVTAEQIGKISKFLEQLPNTSLMQKYRGLN